MHEQFEQVRARISDEMLEAAFAAFYDYLTGSEHFRGYFSSQEQIDRLIQAQKESFKKALTLSDEDFARHYYDLGVLHVRIGVAYEDVLAGLTVIRDKLNDYHVMPPEWLYAWFEEIERHLAQGYFDCQLREYLESVRQLHHSLDLLVLEDAESDYLTRPLDWFEEIARRWLKGERKLGSRIIRSAEQCLLHGLIETMPMRGPHWASLHHLHREQHRVALGLDHFLAEGNAMLATFMLSRLYAISMAMFNQMMAAEAEVVVEQMKHDPLTSLLTRHDLELTFTCVKRDCVRLHRGLGVIMADIDHFKRINDTFGHPAGDAVLKAVAAELRRHLRDRDAAIRYGGEEFLLLISSIERENLCEVAERIRSGVERLKIVFEGEVIDPRLSLGVLHVPVDAIREAPEALVARADALLYQAKRNGRNRVMCGVFEPDDSEAGDQAEAGRTSG